MFAFFISIWASTSISASEITANRVDDLLHSYFKLKQFNGVALVAHHNKILLYKGYGLANVEWNIQHTTTGKFKIASVTKQFTALLILQLVQQNKLQLDETIGHYLPLYRQDTGSKITIRHLLNHTSGLGNFFHLPQYQSIEARNLLSRQEFITTFCSEDLLFEPGSDFRYSNAGYTILGYLIEHITGKPFSKVLHENIFIPAGMAQSGFNDQDKVITERVTGYERTLNTLKRPSYIDMSVPFAAGSIYSTAKDLLLWHQALNNNSLLSKTLTKELYKITRHRNYAAGWLVDKFTTLKNETLTKVHHGGAIQGFNASIARILEDNLVVILLNNTGGAPMTEMTDNIINIVYQKPIKQPKLRFSQLLFKKITTEGINNATQWYLTQHAQNNGFSERGLNRFGYELIEAGQIEAAIAFFEINTTLHPESANTYDSLAEALYLDGQLSLALTQYQKAQSKSKDKSQYQSKIKALTNELNNTHLYK